MFQRFSHSFYYYFRRRFSKQLEELYLSVAILDLALAAVALYEPIYLYGLGYGIAKIMLYYVVVYGVYFFIVPLGGIFVARRGPERSIALSSIMMVGYYGSLFLLPQWAGFFFIAPLFYALQKMFYWPAYHTDFITSSSQGERGKEFSGLWSLSTLMFIIGPVIGGAIIKFFGFPILFAVVVGMILLSNVPLFIQKIPYIPQEYSYWESLRLPFTKQHFKSTLAYLALGEELIMMTAWPIFIALTFKDYLSIGSAIGLASFLTALLTLYFGKIIDRGKGRWTMRFGTIMTSIVWFTRPLLKNIPMVFTSDTVGRMAKNATYVTMTNVSYERAVEEKNVIERGVFYEQGFALGKMLTAVVVMGLAGFFSPFSAAFVWSGVVSLLYLVF